MKGLLVAINILLVAAILGVALYWNPVREDLPVPGSAADASNNSAKVTDARGRSLPVGGDFTLDGAHGRTSLHNFSGKLVLLQFGYTYCPDICPTSLSILAQTLGSLAPAELAKVQPIFISVDPNRDTPARLEEYTQYFHPRILGLTGSEAILTEIAGRYGAIFMRQESASAGGYVIDHTALTYLVASDGRLVASLPHATPPAELLAEIRKLLPTN